MVQINDQTVNYEPQAPFGGMQGSGHEGGQAAPDEFPELRWISMQRTGRTFP
jgi:acyl-CoA reductase-like NAD-dependent aldehyde dehydrogenase